MKTKYTSALVLLLAVPAALLASPSVDREIEATAKASYNYRTVLEEQVTATARDGVVTLTGNVPDKDDKSLAEDAVSGLPGVTRVKNDIAVKPFSAEGSDMWMLFKIRSRLLVRANVSAATTKILVQDGFVTLSGTATSVAQKDLTEVYAKEFTWVKSVKNDIVVIDSPTKSETAAVKMDDASITTQVKYALLTNKDTSAVSTKVTTDNAAVTISGIADSEAEKTLVTKLAYDVRGTKSVSNNMTVKG